MSYQLHGELGDDIDTYKSARHLEYYSWWTERWAFVGNDLVPRRSTSDSLVMQEEPTDVPRPTASSGLLARVIGVRPRP